jgi:hypothetical protein
VYAVEVDQDAIAEIEALPSNALPQFGELMAVLELAPWSGTSYNRERPDAAMRTMTFGANSEGLVVYLVLEDQRRVVVLRVMWLT